MEERLIINGGHQLQGKIKVDGSKNAFLPIMAGCVLCDGEITLENYAQLEDLNSMRIILQHLGIKTQEFGRSLYINTKNIENNKITHDLTQKVRASIFLLGPLLARFRSASIAYPGGCKIGARPIDLHLKAFKTLGARIVEKHGYIYCFGENLKAGDVFFDFPSVGATESLMMCACLLKGETTLKNVAKEPEIVDLANFLNTLGADISGAGTSEIVINGVKLESLHPVEYTTIPDRIEAGTFMAAVVATRGKALIRNVYPAHLTFFNDKLIKMGASIKLAEPTVIEVSCKNRLNSVNFVTQPYPGFPTDLQAIAMTLLTTANGVGIITESLYENRFMQVPDLRRMGADIHQDRNHAIVKGVKNLTGATVVASDLRAGAALVIAALMANGESQVEKLHHIDRGYETFEHKLRQLGAKIIRYNEDWNCWS